MKPFSRRVVSPLIALRKLCFDWMCPGVLIILHLVRSPKSRVSHLFGAFLLTIDVSFGDLGLPANAFTTCRISILCRFSSFRTIVATSQHVSELRRFARFVIGIFCAPANSHGRCQGL